MINCQCCICKKTIEKGEFDPCALVLLANYDKEWRDQKEQTFFCHINCFKEMVSGQDMYILDPDYSTNGEVDEDPS